MSFLKEKSLYLSNNSLFLLTVSLASFPIVAAIASVPFILLNLTHGILNKENIQKENFLKFLPIYIIFTILLISFIYSTDHKIGLNILFKSQALLVFPFVFWVRGDIDKQTLRKAIKYYIYGVGISYVLSLSIAFFNFAGSGNLTEFTYYELADTLELHPTYFSLFILTAMVFVFSGFSKNNLFNSIFISISVLIIVLLESRIAFLGLLLVFFYGILRTKLMHQKLIILGAFLLGLIAVFNSEALQNRLLQVSYFDIESKDIGTFQENGINQRSWLWTNALEQIKDKPLFGFGLGSQKNYFGWQIEKKLLSEDFNYEFNKAAIALSKKNLHNQYLQVLYESGILGLAFLLLSLFLLLIRFYKNKQTPQLLILFLFTIFMITENLFHRQMGIYFFAFMFSLFLSEKIESLK